MIINLNGWHLWRDQGPDWCIYHSIVEVCCCSHVGVIAGDAQEPLSYTQCCVGLGAMLSRIRVPPMQGMIFTLEPHLSFVNYFSPLWDETLRHTELCSRIIPGSACTIICARDWILVSYMLGKYLIPLY